MQQGTGQDFGGVTGLVMRGGLLMGQSVENAVRDVLDERAAEGNREELFTAADAKDRHVAGQSTFEEKKFRAGAGGFKLDGGVAFGVAIQSGVNVEGAAGDDQAVQAVEVSFREAGVVRQGNREPAGGGQCGSVILAQRVPGVFGVAAGLFGIQGQADEGALGHACN